MTSLLVDAFAAREAASASSIAAKLDRSANKNGKDARESCTFCGIIAGDVPAYKIFEDAHTLAFLDILPIRRGHTLLIPKQHHSRMTDLPDDTSARLAHVLPKLCRAVCRATSQPDFNLVSNNGYAQVVDHVHWHIVPAPDIERRSSVPIKGNKPLSQHAIGLQEIARREELDDDEAEVLAQSIREALVKDGASQSHCKL